jgi:hypothetical protein
VVNFVLSRRFSSGGPLWWSDTELVCYFTESDRLLVQELCGRPIAPQPLTGTACASQHVPHFDPVSAPQFFLHDDLSKHRQSRLNSQRFTEDVVAVCSPGSALGCIVTIGLDGFTCCSGRLKLFLQKRTCPLAFLLLTDTSELTDDGASLINGILPDRRPFIFIHQDDILALEPSSKARLLIDAWDRK